MSRDAEYSHTLVCEPYFLNLFGKVKSEDENNKMLDTFNKKKVVMKQAGSLWCSLKASRGKVKP